MCKEAMKCQQGGLRTVSIREHPVCQDNSQTMRYTLIYRKYPELLSLWVKKVDEGFPGAEALGKRRTITKAVGLLWEKKKSSKLDGGLGCKLCRWTDPGVLRGAVYGTGTSRSLF